MGSTSPAYTPKSIALSYDDYCLLPDDGKRYELFNGELIVTPAPEPKHQQVLRNLFRLLDAYVHTHNLGEILFAPIDVILSNTTVVQPDMVFIHKKHLHRISKRGIEGPPDLAVEILSPTTAQRDRTVKLKLYARFKIPHYWITDLDTKTLDAYHLTQRGYRRIVHLKGNQVFHPALFPSLEISLHSIWESNK